MSMFFLRKRRPSYEQAMNWFKKNMVENKGIIIHTRQPVPYPEVTGYFIPTLYNWGEYELARTCTKWLLSIQLPDGSFPAQDDVPYTFDTGQIIRGLCAALNDMNDIQIPLRKACDWILTQIKDDGSLATPSTELWSDTANDLIHTYVLPPLIQAGKLLDAPEYIDKANFVLAYYKKQEDLISFNRLSHFHAYTMEALCEMGEFDLAIQGMTDVERYQRSDGSIPAYPNVNWVCSTGMAQYAIVWYLIGEKDKADKAIRYLEKIQNKSGGFYGSYGKGAEYIARAEISWGVKYFLDAYLLKLQSEGKKT